MEISKNQWRSTGGMAPPDFGRSVNPISTRHPRIFRPSDGPAIALLDFQIFLQTCPEDNRRQLLADDGITYKGNFPN